MIFRRIVVGDQERVLVTREGRFQRILGPGVYWLWTLFRSIETTVFNVRDLVFTSPWADYLVKERKDVTQRWFTLVETGDAEIAVLYLEGKVARVIAPGKRVLFWRGPLEVTAEVINVREKPEVDAGLLTALGRLTPAPPVFIAIVKEGQTGLLYVDGRYTRALAPGTYGFWNAGASVLVEAVDLRRQILEIPGQEILTRDKVSLRVNITVDYQVTDAVLAKAAVKDYAGQLYRSVQLAVRQTLGRRTLEEILAEKTDIAEPVAVEIRQEAETFGLRVGAVALKDIVLPGDVRDILNQVVTAEKQAQANLIRRREETAATRSLLNTAKLLEENPFLVRLKELETLEKVSEKVGKITVNGGLDGLLKQLVSLSK